MNKELKNYLLDNMEITREVVEELNNYNNCLCDLIVFDNDDEFFDIFFDNRLEIARAICYGDYNYNDEYVNFNGYNNLVSYDEYEYEELLIDNINDIVDNLIDYIDYIDLSIEIYDKIKSQLINLYNQYLD